jgi:hypothetical protein
MIMLRVSGSSGEERIAMRAETSDGRTGGVKKRKKP